MFGRDVFLGIDLGTTSVKAALIDEKGNPVAQNFKEYAVYQPYPNWAEQSPQEWWDATASAVRTLLKKSNIAKEAVCSISVSCQAPTCLGIDEAGKPIGNALIWMDRRSQDICDEILQPLASEIRAVCGNRIDPYYFLPKYLWRRKNRPQEAARTRVYLQANGWIVYCMTGEFSIDTTHLTHLQVYDVFHDCWADELMEKLHMDRSMFPTIYMPYEIVGRLTESAAETLGLSKGVPVVAGCTDAAATALGMQHTKPGCLFEMSGQSSGIGCVMDRPVENQYLNLSRGALPNLWNQKGSMSTTGGSLRWFRDKIDLAQDNPRAYSEYDALAAQAPAGANGVMFIPYMIGERAPLWDSNACGMFFGLRTMTTKKDMIRAILEGTAYGLRTIKDTFDAALLTADYLTGTGGGYKSALWAQIKADVLNMPIQVQHADYDGACMGDAILASRALGCALKKEKPAGEIVYTPNQQLVETYDNRYELFKRLYHTNKDLMKYNFEFLTQESKK